MFYRMQSFFTIFLISVLLLSFGTFAEANEEEGKGVINFSPKESVPKIKADDFFFRVKRNIRTGKRTWIDDHPEVAVGIIAQAYGLGIGQGTLEDITILGETFKKHQEKTWDVGTEWIEKGEGKWEKGDATVTCVFKRYVKDVPKHKRKDIYDWSAEGYIRLTPKAWKKVVNQSFSLSWPVSVRGTYGASGSWEKQNDESIDRYAAEGTHGKHRLQIYPYDPLRVSFNKTTFWSDEKLKVTVKMEDLTSASVKLAGQTPILDSTPDAPDKIYISSDFSGLDFSSSNEWYGKVTVTINYDVDGTTQSTDVEQYITVKYRDPLSISFNKTTFGTGEELVVDVERKGLYVANMYINGKYRTYGYPNPDALTKTQMRTTFTSDDVGDHEVKILVSYDKGNGVGWIEKSYTISVIGVSYNNTVFGLYDKLEVTVTKSDLYYANISVNGDTVGKYASGNTSVTLQKSFDSNDGGYHEVVLTINYGPGGAQSHTHYGYITVLVDR